MKLAALCALALALPAGARALGVGIAEQERYMFSDPRFQALGIRYARLSISWDALQSPAQTAALDAWLAAAQRDGVRPLVSFERSSLRGHRRQLPTPAQFARQFARVHARYPWIIDFATWNEANFCGQPTCQHPARVAAYYRQMRRICPTCELLGAELLDEDNMVGWVRAFKHALHHEPAIWGLHNYIGANHLRTYSTRALLAVTHAQVWFTETGGLVSRHNHSAHDFPESPAHAAKATRFIFDRLARLSPRIKRVYIYQWYPGTHRPEAWDSALIGPHGSPRPAFWVLVSALHAFGQLPATPAATKLLATAARSAPATR